MASHTIDISMDFDEHKPSTNFGGGIELLMNGKKKAQSSASSTNIHIDDLNNLEEELNALSQDAIGDDRAFGLQEDAKPFVSFDEEPSVRILADDYPEVGSSTANIQQNNRTWDGYGQFNNIPMNPDANVPSGPQLSDKETRIQKLKYVKLLEKLEKQGYELTKKYNMDSDLQEMMAEAETIMEEKNVKSSVKFQSQMMMALVNGIEFLNSKFDPFDIQLDGWGEQVSENISDYEDVFKALHEKYKSKAKIAPELQLLFQLAGSGMLVHMSNTMLKAAMPSSDEILRQNPEMMRHFQTAAINSMASTNPGFAGFMESVVKDKHPSAPPAPAPAPARVRPDIAMARGNNEGVDMRTFAPAFPEKRPDMKGPSDISSILGGLKTKNVEVRIPDINNNSTISADDVRSLNQDGNIPKRSKRRAKSDKNTVSLDI